MRRRNVPRYVVAAVALGSCLAVQTDSNGQCGTWQPYGTGVTYSQSSPSIKALTYYNGELIAGGKFDTAGGQPANNIARWDGSSWHPLGAGVIDTGGVSAGVVTDFAVYDGDLIVCGTFETAGGIPAIGIASWNGVEWQSMGQFPLFDNAFALLIFEGDLIAATDGGVIRWNGTRWDNMNAIFSADVEALGVWNGYLLAGGDFGDVNGLPSSGRLAKWNGVSWQPFGTPPGDQGSVFAIASFNGDLVIGGDFVYTGKWDIRNRLARWDGAAWQPLGTGMSESGNESVFSLLPYAGQLLIGHSQGLRIWDGVSFTSWWQDANSQVDAMIHLNNLLIVGGWFQEQNGAFGNGIARFLPANDSSAWNSPFDGPFDDSDNWTNGIPGQCLTAVFDSDSVDLGPTYTCLVNGPDAVAQSLQVVSQREVFLTLFNRNCTTLESNPLNPPAILVGDLPNPDFSRLTLRNNSATLKGLSGPIVSIGRGPGSKGLLTVKGSATSRVGFTSTRELTIGEQGIGIVDLLGNTNNFVVGTAMGDLTVGTDVGSNGTLRITGNGASLGFSGLSSNLPGYITFGNAGASTVEIKQGADFIGGPFIEECVLGLSDQSISTMTLDGAGSTWSMTENGFIIGDFGDATLNIKNGATLTTSTFGPLVLARETDSSASVLITGVDSKWTEDAVQMLVAGAGSATLAVCNGGSLEFPNVSVNPNGTISGDGTLITDVLNFGQISPGCVGGSGIDGAPVAGVLTITGNYRQIGAQPNQPTQSGKLNLEIGGNQPGVNQDQLVVTGTTELGGGLFIELVNGFRPGAQNFDVLNAAGIDQFHPSFDVAYLPALDGKFMKVNYPISAIDGSGTVGPSGGTITLTVQDLSSILSFNSLEPPLPGSPTAGVVGDFNNDQLDDLAITITNGPSQSGDLLVFLSAGGGAFQTAQQYQVGAQPSALTVGQFNDGGSLDIAVANRETGVSNGTAMVFGNNGSGTLFSQIGSAIPVGINPSSIAAGDFRTVGVDDLLVANTDSDTVSHLQNDGAGSWPIVIPIPTQPKPIVVTPADIDNPRDLAFVVLSNVNSNVTVFRNTGGGVFPPSQSATYPVGDDPRDLHVVDLNEDGNVDVVTANLAGDVSGGTVSVLVNTGTNGALAPSVNLPLEGSAAYSIVSANLDHPIDPQPGDPDLVDLAVLVDNAGTSEIRILRNDTTTATVALTLLEDINPAPAGSIELVTGDLDGVNGPDLVAINGPTNPLNGPSSGGGTDGPPPQPSLRVLLNDIGTPKPVCRADVAPVGALDNVVGVPDLLFIINNWGPCVNPRNCPADIAPEGPPIGDDIVGVPDLLYIINNWGPCD